MATAFAQCFQKHCQIRPLIFLFLGSFLLLLATFLRSWGTPGRLLAPLGTKGKKGVLTGEFRNEIWCQREVHLDSLFHDISHFLHQVEDSFSRRISGDLQKDFLQDLASILVDFGSHSWPFLQPVPYCWKALPCRRKCFRALSGDINFDAIS